MEEFEWWGFHINTDLEIVCEHKDSEGEWQNNYIQVVDSDEIPEIYICPVCGKRYRVIIKVEAIDEN